MSAKNASEVIKVIEMESRTLMPTMRIRQVLTMLREQGQMLRMEVARLESPDRILRVAKGRLGMVPPPTRMYLKAALPGDPLPPPGDDPFGTVKR